MTGSEHPCWPLGNGDWMTKTCDACCGYECCTTGFNHNTAILIGVLLAVVLIFAVLFICCYKKRYRNLFILRGKYSGVDTEKLLDEEFLAKTDGPDGDEQLEYQPSSSIELSKPPPYTEQLPQSVV